MNNIYIFQQCIQRKLLACCINQRRQLIVDESENVDITLKIVNRKFNESLTDRNSRYFRDTAAMFCEDVRIFKHTHYHSLC